MTFTFRARTLALAALAIATIAAASGAAQASSAKPTVHITINHASITLGSKAVLSGSVAPNQHNHTVYLQQRSSSKWHAIAHKKLGTKSRYSFTVQPGSTGTRAYRLYDPKTTSRPKAYSRTVTLTIHHAASSNCTPGYSPCIAPGSDVDCAGGSGNGPRYVVGPVYVTGSDPYGLDADGDGVGCE
jgi:hypothetical protein